MAPKSRATLLAEQLKKAGTTRSIAAVRLQTECSKLSRSRLSQILTSYWGRSKKETTGEEDITTDECKDKEDTSAAATALGKSTDSVPTLVDSTTETSDDVSLPDNDPTEELEAMATKGRMQLED